MTDVETDVVADRRPRPGPDDISRFYWEGAAAGQLLVQRCRSCTTMQFPPDICCGQCQSQTFDHVALSGRGRLYSYAVVDRALHAGFVDSLPYVVALVELEEQAGLRVLTNIVAIPPGTDVSCGMPLEVTFERRDDVTMPQFRPAGQRP